MENINDLLNRYIDYSSDISSDSLKQLSKSQEIVKKIYKKVIEKNEKIKLFKQSHIEYLIKSLYELPEEYQKEDSSHTWHLYFILHSLQLLKLDLSRDTIEKISQFFFACQNNEGGFGGNHGQLSHLGATYSSICALCILGSMDSKVLEKIDRDGLKKFIISCKCEDGSFKISPDDEVDLRALYCAIVVSRLTNIYSIEMFNGSAKFIASTQNYDGGFGSHVGIESHAGYTYCAYASLILLNQEDLIDRNKLLRFATQRQINLEGGFQGRPAKLVDSCYSFWIGSLFPLIQANYDLFDQKIPQDIFDRKADQNYLLYCAQSLEGGFKDFPTKNTDLHHTCYSLSSYALSQYSLFDGFKKANLIGICEDEQLSINHPLYNITRKSFEAAKKYFYQ